MISIKSNERSDLLRAAGNKLYSQRSFHDALVKYNESLCFAEADTVNLGLAYANRSAIYLEMKLYDRCLKNIEMARMNHYPIENLEILSKREMKCRELMKEKKLEKDPWSFFKLSYPANKKLPFVAGCLEVKSSEKYGRHVVTNRQLKVGDILAIEEPFYGLLLTNSNHVEIPESNIYQRCSYCLRDNAMDLFPCSQCCRAMFCSVNCSDKSFKRYHNYECPVMDLLGKSGNVHMALRLLFIALSSFDGSIENLEMFLKQNESRNQSVFELDASLPEYEDDKELLLTLFSFTRSSNVYSLKTHEMILKNHPQLGNLWDDHQEFIESFLHRQCQTSDLNFHGIFGGSLKKDDELDRSALSVNLQLPIGSASLLFASLINHSCANNVLRTCVDGKIVVIVCRPIEKGAQLFDCYKSNFIKDQKPERQARLLKEFGFVCDCEACVGNFATPPALNFKDHKILKFAQKTDAEMIQLPLGRAMKKFWDCCDVLNKHHHNFPCFELSLLQKCISTFLLRQAEPSILFP